MYIAVHIRLGDKVNGPDSETHYIPLKEYFDKCKEVKNNYGLNAIVVCSDTSDGLEEFLSFNDDFEILFNQEERNKNNWKDSIVPKIMSGENDKKN